MVENMILKRLEKAFDVTLGKKIVILWKEYWSFRRYDLLVTTLYKLVFVW